MKNYIVLHGSFGSKDGNWFPWIKEQLENRNKEVVVPQMPVGVGNQNFDNWSKEFRKLKKEFYRRYTDGFYVYSPPSKFKNLDGLIKYVTRYVSRPVMLWSLF